MSAVDLGLLAIRVVVGMLMAGHGLGNLFGWLGGFGLSGTGELFERLGFKPGRAFAAVTGVVEVAAGLLFLLGLLTPLAAAGIVGIMLATIRTAHAGKGPWYFNGGWEYNLTLLTVAAAVAFAGPGKAALDAVLAPGLAGWSWGTGALVLGVASGTVALALRTRPAAGPAQQAREVA